MTACHCSINRHKCAGREAPKTPRVGEITKKKKKLSAVACPLCCTGTRACQHLELGGPNCGRGTAVSLLEPSEVTLSSFSSAQIKWHDLEISYEMSVYGKLGKGTRTGRPTAAWVPIKLSHSSMEIRGSQDVCLI